MVGSWSRPIPLEGDEARLYLQKRVGVHLRVTGIFAIVLVCVHALARRAELRSPETLRELAVGLVVLTLAWVVAQSWSSTKVIHLCDALGSFVLSGGLAFALVNRDLASRPELLVLLVAATAGAARAALVPSTDRRTFAIAVASVSPVVVLTATRYGVNAPEGVVTRTLQIAAWAVVVVFMTTIISKRIYGLSRSVEEARRLGQYTLDKRIGAGGMGEVYRASHAMLKRPTAIKLLPAARSSDVDVKRFEREVQLTSQLTHPSTIQIYDFGRSADGTFYYAMELLDGLNLEELVRAYGALPPWRASRILADVCGSLSEAHESGLVHRDIKPQNIMICARGGQFDVVKVLDFGLVRSVKTDPDEGTTKATHIIGTPTYMAPEAITSPDSVDARVDIYAVGMVGYFLLAGAPPFHADSLIGIMAKHIHEAPLPISQFTKRDIPEALEELVLKCLAKSPDERPPSAAKLRDAFIEFAISLAPINLPAWWKEHRERPVKAADGAVEVSSTESLTQTLFPMRGEPAIRSASP